MGKRKNQEFKNKLNQTVQNGNNPWQIQQNVQEYQQSRGVNYSHPKQENQASQKQMHVPQYDMNNLMDNLGDKIPPGVKHMMEQFIKIIPDPAAMDSPKFKKEMKKKMKGFSSVFKSPYE